MKNRAYKYRFYPTDEQATLLAQTVGCVRYAYNSILRWRTDSYTQSKETIGYSQASAKLTEIKKLPELKFLNDVSCVPLQQSSCRCNKVCVTSKRRLKTSLKVGRNIQHSKRRTENNPPNLQKVHSNM